MGSREKNIPSETSEAKYDPTGQTSYETRVVQYDTTDEILSNDN